MAAKTLATYISELSAGVSIGAGDKVPVLESGGMVYFDGAGIGGGITALTGDITASGTGSVVASIGTGVIVNADINASAAIDATKIADGTVSNTEFQYLNGVSSAIQTQLDAKVDENAAIVGATKTKITYDTKGLVTSGTDATTADIADSIDKRYVTDAQLVVIGNTSGTNTGDQDLSVLQPKDPTLTAFAALTIAADSLTIGTGADAFSQTSFAANTFPAKGSTGSLVAKTITDFGLSLVDDADASTARTTLGLGTLATQSGTFSGTSSGTNTGDQTITNSSDATSHTVTLSASGGSVQFVEGSGVTLTTTGTGSAGIVTIAASGSGDITNGGNTTGAAVTIGTNDAFGLNFETNNVTRMAITGGASTGGAVTITNVTANTNTVQDVLTIQTNSTGTAAASFGGGILFQGESSTTDNQDIAGIQASWSTATHASRTSQLKIRLVDSATAIGDIATFGTTNTGSLSLGAGSAAVYSRSGITTATAFTIGNSSSTVTISSSSTGGAPITIASSAVANPHVVIGSTNLTSTTATKTGIDFSISYTVASGTGYWYPINIAGDYNLTGTASGTQRSIYIHPTLTSLTAAEYRAIDIAGNHASAKGIYQSGASTTNNFVGATNFGSTSAPNSKAIVEMTSTTQGFLPPRMTGTERDAISSPPAGLVIYNTTTNKLNVYTTAWEAVTSA